MNVDQNYSELEMLDVLHKIYPSHIACWNETKEYFKLIYCISDFDIYDPIYEIIENKYVLIYDVDRYYFTLKDDKVKKELGIK